MRVGGRRHFDYHQSVIAHDSDAAVAPIAAAIGEPARARMLYCLIDGRARTSTELAVVAGVTPSTASVHLQRLKARSLVKVVAQGKHRYYTLDRAEVASALEALNVLAGGPAFTPGTPPALRAARTCYDHVAGTLGVALYDALVTRGWVAHARRSDACDLTQAGAAALGDLGVDVAAARAARRRFAFACLDWSERRPHLGGSLGAALLGLLLRRRWVDQDLDSRILRVTPAGRRELGARLAVRLPGPS
jgi:DNA-binding transcriptional ArsR family regulator